MYLQKEELRAKKEKDQKIKSPNSEGISQLIQIKTKNPRKEQHMRNRTPGNISQRSFEFGKEKETKRSLKLEFKNVLFVWIHTNSIYQPKLVFFSAPWLARSFAYSKLWKMWSRRLTIFYIIKCEILAHRAANIGQREKGKETTAPHIDRSIERLEFLVAFFDYLIFTVVEIIFVTISAIIDDVFVMHVFCFCFFALRSFAFL